MFNVLFFEATGAETCQKNWGGGTLANTVSNIASFVSINSFVNEQYYSKQGLPFSLAAFN